MTRNVKPAAMVTVVAVLMTLGCSSMKDMVKSKPNANKLVVVQLFDPVAGADVPITVNAGGSTESVEAVKHMQNDDFDKAVSTLQGIQKAGKADDRDLFALGVSLEKLEKLAPAIEAYKAANLKRSDEMYQASRRRATEKMK